MKRLLIMVGLMALGAAEANAQFWGWGAPPPPPPSPYWGAPPGPPPGWRYRTAFSYCEQKARQLHEFEWRTTQDGRVTKDERRWINALRSELAAKCGGGRWHPDRGWYHSGRY